MDVEWWDSELSIVPVKPLIWLIYMYSIHMRDDKGTAWSEQKLISGTKCQKRYVTDTQMEKYELPNLKELKLNYLNKILPYTTY